MKPVHTENDRGDFQSKNFKLYLLIQDDLTIFLVTKRSSDFGHLTLSTLTYRCSPYTPYYKETSDLESLDSNYTYTRRRPFWAATTWKCSNRSKLQDFPPATQNWRKNSRTHRSTKTLWYNSKINPRISPTTQPSPLRLCSRFHHLPRNPRFLRSSWESNLWLAYRRSGELSR
jgi:hypothetical protein